MRTGNVAASDIRGTLRFDSKFHLSKHNPVLQILSQSGLPTRTVAELVGADAVWCGNIFTRVYASDPQHGKPLLAPYDVFRYLPWSDKILSRSEVRQFDRLSVKRGTLMIVCSGRNLGPVTIADSYCEQFAMSHDMIRIEGGLSEELLYVAAFLSSSFGQAVIRTDMNGSVIDHTDAPSVRALRIPLIPDSARQVATSNFKEAFLIREKARLELKKLAERFVSKFGLGEINKPYASDSHPRRFSVNASQLTSRLDVEPHAPQYSDIRKNLLSKGGRPLSSVADVIRPSSRYKTAYVQDANFGIPLMNGRQIAQYQAIGLRLMNISGFSSPDSFRLTKGTTLLTADGRAEENLADCVLVARDREGWGASGHVHRVVPHSLAEAGLIYLACSSHPVQAQLKSLSTGSVVDALSEEDVGSVIIPYATDAEARELSSRAEEAWTSFADAAEAERIAIAAVEDAIRQPIQLHSAA